MKKREKSSEVSNEFLLKAEERQRKFDIFSVFLILFLGIYQSFIYWGHQVVPHFDFSCFPAVARELINFQIPGSFKRAPLVGLMQILFGKITGGINPDFTGGWLLNSVLHPLNGLLIFLIAKKIVPKAAFWIALLTILNPQVLQLMTEAIAETPLLFSFLITFYLILKRSKWCYLSASLSTMIRYEGAGLIFVAFLIDIAESKNNKERLKAFLYSAAASIPLAIWLAGTLLHWNSKSGAHYLTELGGQSGNKFLFLEFINLTWQVAFSQLVMLSTSASEKSYEVLFLLSKIFISIFFIAGVVYASIKKNWFVLAMTIFLLLYLLIHAAHAWLLPRFCSPITWIPMIVCCFGLKGLWKLINKNNRLGNIAPVILQAILLLTAFCMTMEIYQYLPQIRETSRSSYYLPYIVIILAFAVFAGETYIRGVKNILRNLAVVFFAILMVVSNQFALAGTVGNGQRDLEFKYLVDWYLANAKPDEKIVFSCPWMLETMAPGYKSCFVAVGTMDANNPLEFVQQCLKNNISYAAWDSRMGMSPNNRYYKDWKMANIAPLAAGKTIGPYQFLTQLRAGQRRYINVYRLNQPTQDNTKKP
jgi:hypothetical protein